MEVRPWIKATWKAWDLRSLILTSLFLQVILIFTGNLRKRITTRWLSFILWLAYLQADSIAISALGMLARSDEGHARPCCIPTPPPPPSQQSFKNNYDLLTFWAPFLLLHLGGPDTITAFSLEDNELWLRHLLNLMYQVVFAIYVYFGNLPKTLLLYPALLMFLAGILKYAERSWALMSASMGRLRSSMITEPDPGPNYAKFMQEYASKKAAGFPAEIIIEKEPGEESKTLDTEVEQLAEPVLLSKAYEYIQKFKCLVVDLILSFHERNESQAFFLKRDPTQAFKLVETELAFLYEILYTKAPVIHTKVGAAFRVITLCATLSSLLAFIFIKKSAYVGTDILITYTLLVGALVLECYSTGLLVFSEWTYVQLEGTKLSPLRGVIFRTISFFKEPERPRWSNSMAQYDLLSACIRDLNPSPINGALKLFGLKDLWEHFWHTRRAQVSPELKDFIFNELKSRAVGTENSRIYRRFGAYRGQWALQKKGYLKEYGWSIEVEFDESILLWHIATDLCYHTPSPKNESMSNEDRSTRERSKQLSDYMLYLLLMQPFMLTAGIGQIIYGDTCAEARYVLQPEAKTLTEERASVLLLDVETTVPPIQVKGDRSQSVLYDGCILAKQLQLLGPRKWNMISTVWIEMLSYAAGHCRGLYHAKQLSFGGELLTLVWLLSAHLGIGEQFRIEAGNARAKLVVGK